MPDASVPLPAGEWVTALALDGLTRMPKRLPPKLFYDEAGCRLFYRITELPEYYLTRTELALLRGLAPSLAAELRRPTALVEYGASDETKARLLCAPDGYAALPFAAYVPIDIAPAALAAMRLRLARDCPGLAVFPVIADFLAPIALPPALDGMARFGFFPGSTIGNLDPPAARRFLADARATLGPGARMLVGVDLRKDPAILLPAYDDASGVTAAFNLNLLARLNREAGADFNLTSFSHRALWNDAQGRIEMHLVSRRDQIVRLGGRAIHFRRGETIHTENSYKHTPEGFIALAAAAGWRASGLWTDPAGLFSVHLLDAPV